MRLDLERLETRDCPCPAVSLVGQALVLAPHDGRTLLVVGLVADQTGQTAGVIEVTTLGPRGRNLLMLPADAVQAVVGMLHPGDALLNLSGMPDVVLAV